MTPRPFGWRLMVRRLTRCIPPESAKAILGDLAEDYRADRQTRGWLSAEWRAWRDARSIAHAYRPAGREWFDGLRFDLRLAARGAVRQPGLTLAVVLPLAFAVAANTSLFSIVDGLLFRPLPFRDSESLVSLRVAESSTIGERLSRYRELIDGVAASPLLTGVAIAGLTSPMFGDAFAASAAADAGLRPAVVSPGFFNLVGIQLIAGRDIGPADSVAGSPLTVVISHDVWQRLFGGDPAVVGRVTSLADRSVEVIGIAPSGTTYPIGANVWTPSGPPVTGGGARMWSMARLSPGVTADQFRSQYPDLVVTPIREAVRPGDTASIVFLLGATALFLLAAWVQIGALMLGRAVSRLPDARVRVALGAGPARLARQYVLDGVVLAALTLLAAWLATPVLTTFLAGQLPRQMTIGQAIAPDLRTFGFAAAVSAIGAILLAAAPAGLLRRTAPGHLLAGGTSGVTASAERTRATLLVAQIACSSLLLCVAGLALRSFVRVSHADVGFNPERLWQFSIPSLPAGLSDEEHASVRIARRAEIDQALEALRALPGVEAAGASVAPAVSGRLGTGTVRLPGKRDREPVQPWLSPVTAEFLRALQPRLRSGRFPSATTISAPGPAASGHDELVVNTAFARAVAATPEVMERQIQVAGFRGKVVGVVDDLVQIAPGVPVEPQVFAPLTRGTPSVLLIRATSGESNRPALESTLARFWGPSAGSRLTAMTDEVATLTAPWRARTILFGLIAALCVPLVVTGISGALYAAVRARTREIAVRLALGADARTVHRTIVRRALSLAGIGAGIGLAGGVAAGRLMSHQLFGIRAADISTLGSVAAMVLVAAWLAALLPARLASAIAPADALKER
jgi:putative ABC transport system permease protein